MRACLQIIPALILLLATSACNRKATPNYQVVQPAPGTFEICILANVDDDALAIQDAEEYSRNASTDPTLQKLLKSRAASGEPPPPPKVGDGGHYTVLESECTYRWTRLSPLFLRSEQIDPGPDSLGKSLFERLKRARADGELCVHEMPLERGRLSRVFWSQERPAKDDILAGVDYFLLIRQEPPEHAIRAEEMTITLEYNSPEERVLVGRLDDSGTEKFAALTQRNRPSAETSRSLAMVVRGEVVSAAMLKESITQGRFVLEMGSNASNDAEQLFAALQGR